MTTEQQASNRPRAKAAFWFIGVVVIAGAAWLLSEFSQYRLREVGTWPVSPASSDHPIANTFGELVEYRSTGSTFPPYRKPHEGVDILAVPHGKKNPSEVIVTAEGIISHLKVDPDDNYNEVVILATDGTHKYTYMHLEHPPPANLVAAKIYNATVYPHEVVGEVRNAFPCGYNHLHYGVTKIVGGSEKAINPLKNIFPKPDQVSPDILSIHLARHSLPRSRWSTFSTVGNRTVVSGGVDIVAAVTDRDDAGSVAMAVRNVGLYDVKWRACAIGNPNCSWNETHRYDEMWPSPSPRPEELFSFTYPWETTVEEWSDLEAWIFPTGICLAGESTYMVLRSSAGTPSWNTQEKVNGSPMYKDGDYVLSVKALDYANQADIYTINVCVANVDPASCSLTNSIMRAREALHK